MQNPLPENFTLRPATMDDAGAVSDLVNACDMALIGKPRLSADEIRHDWSQPSFKLDDDTRLVFGPDGALVGYAVLWDATPHVRAFASLDVHPDAWGGGVELALAQWIEQRARRLIPQAPNGARVVLAQDKLNIHGVARELLLGQGYQIVRHGLQMLIEMEAPPEPLIPEGFAIRPFIRGKEERAVVTAIREAFTGHYGYVLSPFEEDLEYWRHYFDTAPDAIPELWFVAVEANSAGETIVGTSLCHPEVTEDPDMGWVFALGVRPPWRQRGLGLALLQTSFAGLYRHGKRKAGLSADAENLTGAVRLYEKAGMHVMYQIDVYEKELRAGTSL